MEEATSSQAQDESSKVDVPRLPISLTRKPAVKQLPRELLAEYEPVGEDLLGEGAFAVVWLLRHRQTAELYALKSIEKYPLRIRNMIEQMNREVRIQQNLSHPNILRLVRAYDDEFYVYMLLEYCAKGSLRTLMSQLPYRRYEEAQAAYYFLQIAKGVEWMHRNACVHRDLKLENMLLTDKEVVKICDFGWSAEMQIERILKTTCGTTSYWAPEIWENAPQDEAVDMWALGCMLYEMLAGHAPFHERDHNQLKEKVLALQFGYPPWFSNELCHAVHVLLQKVPAQRAKCADLISHAWFGQHHADMRETEALTPQGEAVEAPRPSRAVDGLQPVSVAKETTPTRRQISASAEAPAKRPAVVLQNSYAPNASILAVVPLRMPVTKSLASSPHAPDQCRMTKPVDAGTPKGSFTGHRVASVGPVRRAAPSDSLAQVGPARSQSTGPCRTSSPTHHRAPSPCRASQEPLLASRSNSQVHQGPMVRRATVISDASRLGQTLAGIPGTSLLDSSLQHGRECAIRQNLSVVAPSNFDAEFEGAQTAMVARTVDGEFVDLGPPTRCNMGPCRRLPVMGQSCGIPLAAGTLPTVGNYLQQPLGTAAPLLASQQRLNMVAANPAVTRSRLGSESTMTAKNRAAPPRSFLPHSNSGKLLPFGSCSMIKQNSFSVAPFGTSPRSMFCT